MNEAPTKLLEDRIAAIIERVKDLAAERDTLKREIEAMKSRLDHNENDNARLRTALEQAIRDLRQE